MDIKKPKEKSRAITSFMQYFKNICIDVIKDNFFAANIEVSKEIYNFILDDKYTIYIDELPSASKSFIKLNKNKFDETKGGRQYIKYYVILSLIEQLDDEKIVTNNTIEQLTEMRLKNKN